MPLIGTLNSAVTGSIISSAEYNENMNAIRNAFNDSAVLTDVARNIVAVHTFAPAAAGPPFTLSANAQGQLVSGLNADQLDGEEGTHYLALANATGSLPFSQVSGSMNDSQHGNRGGGSLHAAVVAGGAAGFMTGADKTKLNGIETGAQVNTVTSVHGRTGAVVGDSGDYSFSQISGTAAKSQIPSSVAYENEVNTFGPNQVFNANVDIGGALGVTGNAGVDGNLEVGGDLDLTGDFIGFQDSTTKSLDGDFSSGSMTLKRVGKLVVLRVSSGSHTSSSQPTVHVPSGWGAASPPGKVIYDISPDGSTEIQVSGTQVRFTHRDSSGGLVSRTSIPSGAGIAYYQS